MVSFAPLAMLVQMLYDQTETKGNLISLASPSALTLWIHQTINIKLPLTLPITMSLLVVSVSLQRLYKMSTANPVLGFRYCSH